MTTNLKKDGFIEEKSVYHRYTAAAKAREELLCCPVEYTAKEYLSAIPDEILERDYGCGDPTPYAQQGETVLDLGSGGGKLCYILAQVVGKNGKVIGVDCNLEMLGLARKYQREVAERLGYGNVDFRYGMIQDLRLDLDILGKKLEKQPAKDSSTWLDLRNLEERLRTENPLIADESVDCVISNCVLNLVRQRDRNQLFSEVYRVLKRGGRAAISDIVSDEDVPPILQNDPALWSGCISGAFREDQFISAFEKAGFYGIEIVKRQREPWQVIKGIEFRSLTVVAHKGKEGPCLERNQAVIYRGPFQTVKDDDGHLYHRGKRMAVCDKTYQLLQMPPYKGLFETVDPREPINPLEAPPFDCNRAKFRHARETKGLNYDATIPGTDNCQNSDFPCC